MRGNNCLCIVFLLLLLTACTGTKTEQHIKSTYALLPVPVSMQPLDGDFKLSESTTIIVDGSNKELLQLAGYLAEELKNLTNLQIQISSEKNTTASNCIHLVVDATIYSPQENFSSKDTEAYSLDVTSGGIAIRAATPGALFYGIQTMLQLLQINKDEVLVPNVKIFDYPAFSWRGAHLDVCRHFFPVTYIKKMLDAMAMHKLNVFHWHLTDDQGWRIEIKKYPLLTSVGAWRKETVVGHMSAHPLQYDGKKYGGFYTQEQIKEVVAYAQSRHITIVPEIEMPGHAVAALSAYPEYSCTGGPFEVFTEWGESNEAFCGGKEETFDFIQNILDEVVALFPGKYIHVGGDECSKKRWEKCKDCMQRMKTAHLKNEMELQSYFIKRVESYLRKKGKKLIGWDEILQGGLPEGATVMSWRGREGGIEASATGHDAVMTPGKYCYFDHYQGVPSQEPLAIGGYLPLDSVYSFDPIQGLDSIQSKHILGAQANTWTEYIPTEQHLEYMLFPRLCAMAEVLWSPKGKQDYVDFLSRMDAHYRRLDKKNIQYRVDVPTGFYPLNRFLTENTTISLHCDIPSAMVRYTLDGSVPQENSDLYVKPFQLSLAQKQQINAKSFLKNGKSSAVLNGRFERTQLLKGKEVKQIKKGLAYWYYDKVFPSAASINGKPLKTGVVDSIQLPDCSNPKAEWFAVEYKGYLKVEADDVYTFYLNSDDGALLFIDDELVVDNDGFHYAQEKVGSIALAQGYHSLRIAYFEGKYSGVLDLSVSAELLKKCIIPSTMLWHDQ